jgi:LytS/YehU family sensor histidine kinase
VLLEEKNNRPEMMRGYQVMSTIYHHLGNNDMAYEYLVKYNTIKDSIQNKQFLLRIYNAKKDAEDEKKEAKVTLLDKDNKIKKQQLSQQAMLRNFLLVMLLVLMAAAAFIFRNLHLKRKNEQLQNGKQQAELKEHAARLEMQALRAQMNPHFIFNCLSSINSFILDNDTDTASDYLTRFSRLIRMVLTNSEKSLITLEEELKMLRLYMDMERLRFENAFDYTITYTNDVDVETLMVPPLLLQPFCENAIWHGLMHKEGKGHLTITIIKKEEYIHCIITDDGIGRSKAEELNSKSANKEKSMGLKITNERLSLFNNEEGVATAYEIEDILDSTGTVTGTKVNLKIRHKNLMEKIA